MKHCIASLTSCCTLPSITQTSSFSMRSGRIRSRSRWTRCNRRAPWSHRGAGPDETLHRLVDELLHLAERHADLILVRAHGEFGRGLDGRDVIAEHLGRIVVQALMEDCIASLTSCCTLPSVTQTSSSSKRTANSVAVSMDET
eukprot:scaffold24876_cov45-Phaeocystis_antarctica.AAC.2